MKTYVKKRKRHGLDWCGHNTKEIILEEDGNRFTNDPERLIAADIQKEIADMCIEAASPGTGMGMRFALNVPSLEDITDCYKNRKLMHVSAEYRNGGRNNQMSATWYPLNGYLNLSYLYGERDEYVSYEIVRDVL